MVFFEVSKRRLLLQDNTAIFGFANQKLWGVLPNDSQLTKPEVQVQMEVKVAEDELLLRIDHTINTINTINTVNTVNT